MLANPVWTLPLKPDSTWNVAQARISRCSHVTSRWRNKSKQRVCWNLPEKFCDLGRFDPVRGGQSRLVFGPSSQREMGSGASGCSLGRWQFVVWWGSVAAARQASSSLPVRGVIANPAGTDGRSDQRESTAGSRRRDELIGQSPVRCPLPEESSRGQLSGSARRTPHFTWSHGHRGEGRRV